MWYKFAQNNAIDNFYASKDQYIQEAQSYVDLMDTQPQRSSGALQRIQRLINVFTSWANKAGPQSSYYTYLMDDVKALQYDIQEIQRKTSTEYTQMQQSVAKENATYDNSPAPDYTQESFAQQMTNYYYQLMAQYPNNQQAFKNAWFTAKKQVNPQNYQSFSDWQSVFSETLDQILQTTLQRSN